MNATSPHPVFTDTELVDEVERPFRPSAVVTLILGVISAGVTFSVSLIFLPVITLAVGLYAVRPGRTPRVKPVGRALAVAGMTLALLFASGSLAFHWFRTTNLVHGASVFAKDWFAVLGEGRREFAYELTQPQSQRQLADMPLAEYYQPTNPEVYRAYSAFMGLDVVQSIINAEDRPRWRLESAVSIGRNFDTEFVTLRMVDQTGTIPQPIVITMAQSPRITEEGVLDLEGPRQWYVRGVERAGDES